ncbi:uncharacterized protein LOC115889511 isoform X2 [Sitophilus oryzae]|uniref:Uncharacterized protein LOC115889511 isoform X2 n=1 Tax=Sitophilus oryzae TaxID=7048 RepID=A0A6J2YQ58_SITOR|nr:uncharacterized protein LOC115889511 isoform X2 [Sitophilus oryzae]
MVPFQIRCDYVRGIFIVSGGVLCNRMPDMVTVVTTGLGVSLLAGVLSGVCYVLVSGYGNKRIHQSKSQWHCEICGTYLNTTKNILNEDIVTCFRCGVRVCKEKCARYIKRRIWLCQNCLHPRQSLLQSFLEVIHPNIRDLPITGQSPCSAHTALKEIIERLLKEAVNLPLLAKAHAHPTVPEEDDKNKSYEDLLATAIINKVISSCQNNGPSSSANSVSSRVSTSSRYKDDKEYFFSEETLDSKWKTTDLDTTSVSSLDDWIHSESSFGSKKYVDKVTLKIKQDIEEVDNLESEPEEDDAEYFRSTSSLLSDSESNWLLQRRNFQGTASPVPVPMLVPNPTSEAKVLIGDKPLDDTSDLSDVGSDYEEPEISHTAHSLLVQSKNIIGGRNSQIHLLENGDVHSESSTDSGVKEVNGKEEERVVDTLESRTDITVDDDNVEDSSYLSICSNTEKEAEYTERYASLPRQIVKNSVDDFSLDSNYNTRANHKTDKENYHSFSDNEFCGNYSKKEKEKWSHTVEMKNNPYSKENIENRLKRSSSAASSLYDSKYCAKLSRMPSGGGDTVSRIAENWPPSGPTRDKSLSPQSTEPPALPTTPPPKGLIGKLTETFSSDAPALPDSPPPKTVPPALPNSAPPKIPIQSTSELSEPVLPEIPKSAPPLELIGSITTEQFIYTEHLDRAVPAVVIPEDDMPHLTVDQYGSPIVLHESEVPNFSLHSSEITSDSDLSYVNSYDVTHSQVIKETKDKSLHIPIKPVPFGISYKTIADENGNNATANNNVSLSNSHDIKADISKPIAKPRNLAKNHAPLENGVGSTTPKYVSSTFISQRSTSIQANFNEDSFDTPPKHLHQKKDNTLISKIYKDPKVRLFRLRSREDLDNEDSPHHTRSSYHQNKTNTNQLSRERNYESSDDGLYSEYDSGKTGKMSFFSSEEDLLSIDSEGSVKHNHVISTINENVATHVGDGDEAFWLKQTSSTPKSESTRRFIYGSQEDLLSIDEAEHLPKRKDNTIITKIYKDPRVLNFALTTHGENMPNLEVTTPVTPRPKSMNLSSPDDDHFFSPATPTLKRTPVNKRRLYQSYDDLSSADISLRSEMLSKHETDSLSDKMKESYNGDDLEVDEIERKHLVRNALGKFSKSEANFNSSFVRATSQDEEIRVSVRDLRKKFENNDNQNHRVVSSLTARSLSKKVKETLKM